MTTYRHRNVLDPIYQHKSYIPSPAAYLQNMEGLNGRKNSNAQNGPCCSNRGSVSRNTMVQLLNKSHNFVGSSVLSVAKNSPAISF